MEQMRRSWLGRSKYILLVLVALLLSLGLYAQPSSTTDTPPTAANESPICKLLSDHFDLPRSSFERDFGPAVSSKSVRHPAPGSRVITIEYAQHVSVTYVTVGTDRRELINWVRAKGIETLRKLGLDVHSFEDVQGLLGKPDSVEGNVMSYLCDRLKTNFSIDPTNYSVSVDFQVSANAVN